MDIAQIGVPKLVDAHPERATDVVVSEKAHNELRELEALVAIDNKDLGPCTPVQNPNVYTICVRVRRTGQGIPGRLIKVMIQSTDLIGR